MRAGIEHTGSGYQGYEINLRVLRTSSAPADFCPGNPTSQEKRFNFHHRRLYRIRSGGG